MTKNEKKTNVQPQRGFLSKFLFGLLSAAMVSLIIYLVVLTVREHYELHKEPSFTHSHRSDPHEMLPESRIQKVFKVTTVPETFVTGEATSIKNNIDSLVIWHKVERNAVCDWIIATSKASNSLFILNANDGNLIKEVRDLDMFRPNGLALIRDLDILCVVERDGHKAQLLQLPSFERLVVFGTDVLKRPYGVNIQKLESEHVNQPKEYRIFITDNYMEQEYDEKKKAMKFKKLPPLDQLDGRVKAFIATISQDPTNSKLSASVKYDKSFGEVTGDGTLKVVESIVVDTDYNRLLIADEHESSWDVKIYNLDTLTYSGQRLGNRQDDQGFKFNAEPEGIALYKCGKSNGYYILTEQLETLTRFLVLNRKDFRYLGTFTGKITKKTDGIAVSRQGFGQFEQGIFVAVHEDAKVAAWKWSDIAKALSLDDKHCT
jgi:3-phytase